MQEFVSQFGGTIALITGAVLGVFYVIGLFSKTSKERNKEVNTTEDRLIDLLKDEVGVLTVKVTKLEEREKQLTADLIALTEKNKTLIEVLQGRDNEAKESYVLVRESNAAIKKQGDNIEQLLKLMERHMKVIEKNVK